jgi:hypothetical protein
VHKAHDRAQKHRHNECNEEREKLGERKSDQKDRDRENESEKRKIYEKSLAFNGWGVFKILHFLLLKIIVA